MSRETAPKYELVRALEKLGVDAWVQTVLGENRDLASLSLNEPDGHVLWRVGGDAAADFESISATVSSSEPGLHNRSSAFDVKIRFLCQSALKASSIAAASA